MKGLFTALITPFTSNGLLDERGLRENIAFQLENGVDGIVALGTTGESPTLTLEEKERIIQIAAEEIKGKVPLMVGTGCFSTQETLKRTKRAKELGADAALIIAPYYNKPTQEGIYRHFSAITSECSLPIMLYNHPGRTGITIELSTLKRLAALPQIIGVKEASGKVEVIKEISQELPDFSVMIGVDQVAAEGMKAGAKGIISVLSNLLPKEMKALIEGHSIDLKAFIEATDLEINPIPIKTMMALAGKAAGATRLPLCELKEENRLKIKELMESTRPKPSG